MKALRKGILFLIFNILFSSIAFAQTETVKGDETVKTGYVTGKIASDDRALNFGYIGFFLTSGRMPDTSRYWRTADYVFPLNKDGIFEAVIPEGSYYVLAVKKAKRDFGPLEVGDHFYYFLDNDGPMKVTVKSGQKIDLGVRKTVPHTTFSETFKPTEVMTIIKGVIRDKEGVPVPDVFVGAYTRPVALGKPDYISKRSGKDGSYELRLPEGGEYYLVARFRLGAPPAPGDYYGRAGDENNPVIIKTGQTIGLDITVNKIQ